MLLFSPKARRLIDAAISDFSDAAQRSAWTCWSQANLQARVPDGPAHDGGAPMPTGIAAVALAALEQKAARLKDKRNISSLNEDEISDLENDLTFIDSVESLLIRNLRDAEAE